MIDIRRSIENLILFPFVLFWIYITVPYYVVVLFIPYMVVRTWMGGSLELTILVFDGLVAFLLLLRKPLKRLDKVVREFNEKARQKADKKGIAA